MAIDNGQTVNVFDQDKDSWYSYDQMSKTFSLIPIPLLTKNFAGIGTREIRPNGIQAIKDVILNYVINNQLDEI